MTRAKTKSSTVLGEQTMSQRRIMVLGDGTDAVDEHGKRSKGKVVLTTDELGLYGMVFHLVSLRRLLSGGTNNHTTA